MRLGQIAALLSRTASYVQVAAVLWLLATGRLLSRSPFLLAVQALAMVVLFSAWRAFPPGQFSTRPAPRAPRLIESGPYRWIRHPMYAAGQLVIWSAVIMHPSPVAVGVALLVVVAVAGRVMTEEPLLRENIPGYADYMRRTKRFVPFVF